MLANKLVVDAAQNGENVVELFDQLWQELPESSLRARGGNRLRRRGAGVERAQGVLYLGGWNKKAKLRSHVKLARRKSRIRKLGLLMCENTTRGGGGVIDAASASLVLRDLQRLTHNLRVRRE